MTRRCKESVVILLSSHPVCMASGSWDLQAEQAPEPTVSWTHYSTQGAAQYYGPVVPAPPQVMPPPQHYGFTPAPMYAQVGKVPPSGEDCFLLGTRISLGCHKPVQVVCTSLGVGCLQEACRMWTPSVQAHRGREWRAPCSALSFAFPSQQLLSRSCTPC